MRSTEIEIPDQSDVIPASIAKEKKHDVQKIIDDLPSCSPKYSLIDVPFRNPKPSEMLQSQQQTPLSIFQLFISSTLLQIMTNHTNLKTSLKRVEETRHQRHWHDTTDPEIEAFIDILLYMRCTILSRIREYWNTNINHAMHDMIINFMSRTRWKQIKRYLKIFNSLDDQKIDTRDIDWWKKLESLTFEFRKTSKTYWLPESHVSVDEQ